MFALCFHIGSIGAPPGFTRWAHAGTDRGLQTGRICRMAAFTGVLALGVSGVSSAQALGTMQVSARVVPAPAAWAGVAEAAAAIRMAAGLASGRSPTRRSGLVQARGEVLPSGGRRLLLVTIHHPHN